MMICTSAAEAGKSSSLTADLKVCSTLVVQAVCLRIVPAAQEFDPGRGMGIPPFAPQRDGAPDHYRQR